MDFEVDYQLSCAADDLEERLNMKFDTGRLFKLTNAWLELFKYDFAASNGPHEMEIDSNTADAKEDLVNLIKEALERNSTLSEAVFKGLSVNEVNKIFCTIGDSLDEMKFSAFCNLISSWNDNALVEYALGSVVLSKLQENSESSACVIHSVKQLALSKPESLSQNIIIPLLTDDSFRFTDFELLFEVFSVLPDAQKDIIILTVSKKPEFTENDWKLLNPLVKQLSQNSLLILMKCIVKFSNRFIKSQVFGRFLVSFCKHLDCIESKEALSEAVKKHETLLKVQALKYLNVV